MEDVRFPDGSFDAVLSSLALHYVKDYAELVSRVYRWLTPGGAFVFSAEHPTFTAYGNQPTGTTPRRGKSSTSRSTGISTKGSGRRFSSARRSSSTTGRWTATKTPLAGRFTVEDLSEPRPPEEMMELPGMKDEMRRPMMLLVSARKPL